MLESAYLDAQKKIDELSVAELDQELCKTARTNETTEMLLCCYLAAMRERGGFREFGYWNIYDYARERFGFGERKTRYLVSLGSRIEELPKIREALASGTLGWCKAVRILPHVNTDNEATWVESAISLSLKDLERRIKDGTDTLAGMLHFPLTEHRRVLWENVLEVYRRRAGAQISPVEAFEYLCAEAMAEYGCVVAGDEANAAPEDHAVNDDPPERDERPPETKPDAPVFPWAAPVDTSRLEQGSFWETEGDAELSFSRSTEYSALRQLVLERDGWQCCYPGCRARKNLEVHHIRFRSRGGPDEPWNLAVVCVFHHELIHAGQIALTGHAPMALGWTPPRLMREVLERYRNNPSPGYGELDVREWVLDPAPTG